jgi:uridine phosphorylase
MVKSDKDLIIEPRRGKGEQLLPETAVFMPNPAEADLAFKHFTPCCGWSQTFNRSCVQVDKGGRMCLAGPALGAAAAAILLEKLIVLGVRTVWLASCCGALDPALAIGKLVVARTAVSGEGVSEYYTDQRIVTAGADVSADLRDFAEQGGESVADGVIWSTDAPYREYRSALIKLREAHGVNGVDMEFSALCAVAAFRGIGLGAIFVVSDLLWTRNWRPGFSSVEFKKKNDRLLRRIIDHGLSRDF